MKKLSKKYLKEQNKNIKVVGVEPESSPVISKGVAGPHMIQGIGAGFIPKTLDTSILDEVIKVIREATGLGLKEAKDIADAGGNVKEGIPASEADELKAKLEEAGATVELA